MSGVELEICLDPDSVRSFLRRVARGRTMRGGGFLTACEDRDE
jgi:hypothetical protein